MTTVIANTVNPEAIVEALATCGWCAVPDFLPPDLTAHLHDEALALRAAGAFRPAAIGQGRDRQLDGGIRGDLIHWLEPPYHPATQQYLDRMEGLRQTLNAGLFLGLFDFECHFAIYPPGTLYRKHLDRFRGDSRRAVSCVLYLNNEWTPDDGGTLRLYGAEAGAPAMAEVLPVGGTLACFLSDRIPHEVLPASRERLSVTGWFRVRA